MKPKFCDTHVHLDFEQFAHDRSETITRAFDSEVVRFVDAGVDIESSLHGISLAEKYPRISAAVGIHPHNTAKLQPDWLEKLTKLAFHPKVCAIGETGLDFYRDISPEKAQRIAFRKQIELARELHLPLIIHVRSAHRETREILEDFGYFKGVFHAFSGDSEFLKWCIDKGFYIGFGGPVTFKNFKNHHIVSQTPLSRILLETDCPYLSPHPYRGKRNEPSRIPLIANKIAEINDLSVAEIAYESTRNAAKLFDFTSPYFSAGRKAMGQIFLTNRGVAEKTMNLIGKGELALEIGPGHGILTGKILEHFDKVIAVELDEELAIELSRKHRLDRLFIINQDILKVDIVGITSYFARKPVIIGNIPYSITSPILFHLADNRSGFDRAVLMMQREVAERICASPGNKTYGIPTVILGRYFAISKKFTVSPGSFSPKPDVYSTVVELRTRTEPIGSGIDDGKFSRLVRSAFSHRRKKVVTNLKAISSAIDWAEALRQIDKNENSRAEQLSIDDYCHLTGFIEGI